MISSVFSLASKKSIKYNVLFIIVSIYRLKFALHEDTKAIIDRI